MAILQAYQADVLKEMDEGDGLMLEAVKELRRATDLALRATKHTACSIGCSMAGSVAAERYLWLNLTEICDKEKVFLMDAPISQSESTPRIERSPPVGEVTRFITHRLWFGEPVVAHCPASDPIGILS
ncbi:hypothetical protein DPX16_21618 [Anabarilius grahami]|uniref:Uncharacterized protein n=1 Tax=Anabarilius grahami TaxID=495550 RepID=A0A3N0XFU1_ANAGA|nr:hypothetical protein DPX16_21618 [Anabarilius grahami]